MNSSLSSLYLLKYNTNYINELKYKVHNHPKEYALKTAQEVESIFIQILIKNMRNTLQKDSLLDNDQSN
ncbi:MAG: flagellar biosynthesis protein FlgJ, partial [Buchnera aphidicola]|nr:flagellar biosynthesis protein FlgJ [Buchnera aphidicola]